MFTVTVRDQLMIAHSFRGDVFGPARRLHGVTWLVDACFRRATLDEDQLVVDIGQASELLAKVLAEFNFRNLDELPALEGNNTTTEFMARVIFDRLAEAIRAGRLGATGQALDGLKVVLAESDRAWASYESTL